MFLASLSYEQRRIFLGLAKEILTIDDGKIDSAEDSYLRGLCAEMSLSFSDEININKEKLIEYFPEKEYRRIVLLELVALGYSNSDYHISQDKYTDEMATLLEIPITELRKFEELMGKYKKIQDEFIQCIEQ